MNVLDIPFCKFLGIHKAAAGEQRLELDDSPSYLNHVGTVHAGAQLTLAETASGQCLLAALPEFEGRAVALLRRVEAKFKNPMQGAIRSRPATSPAEIRKSAEPLSAKPRAIIPITVEILDAAGAVGLVATFDWFVQKT
jgi:acyl-coenzyme A thioesterase PaaI-like protein